MCSHLKYRVLNLNRETGNTLFWKNVVLLTGSKWFKISYSLMGLNPSYIRLILSLRGKIKIFWFISAYLLRLGAVIGNIINISMEKVWSFEFDYKTCKGNEKHRSHCLLCYGWKVMITTDYNLKEIVLHLDF